MLVPILLVALAAGERPNEDAFVPSAPFYSPGQALAPAGRALFDSAWVSGFEPRTGVPTVLWAPPGQPRFRAAGLTAEQAARRYLFQWAPVYRWAPAGLADVPVARVHDLGGGAVVVSFSREANGLPVFGSALHVVMTDALELVALTGHLPPQPAPAAFALTAESAVTAAVLDATGERVTPSPQVPRRGAWVAFPDAHAHARQGYYALPLRLVPAYQVELATEGLVVSAEDGTVLKRASRRANHSYRVWADGTPPYAPWDGPWQDHTPNALGVPSAFVPPNLAAPLVTLTNAGLSTNDPWLPVGAGFLEGNHAVVYADLFPPDGRNDPDAGLPVLADGGLPDGGFDDAGVPYRLYPDPRVPVTAPGTLDHLADFGAEPTVEATRNAGGVNAFFIVNWLHDVFYDLGFDEAAGNAQADNFGRGGAGGDPLRIELQDHSGRDNANMTTPPDGLGPKMQLFLWTSLGPQRLTVNDGSDAGPMGAPIGYPATTPGWLVTGDLVEPIDADGGWGGCSPTNLAAFDGKIVLTHGSTCNDAVRVAFAADAGALGLVVARASVVQNAPRSPALPVHQVQLATAAPWRATLAAAGTVNVTLDYPKQPDRDSAVDATTVVHEWVHHLTNRLIGNADGLTTQQARGLAEGWSDFVAAVVTLRPSDATAPGNANWDGAWALSPWNGGGTDLLGSPTASFFYGLGRYPVSADKAKNPLTFRHIGKGVPPPASPPPSYVAEPSEVHATGEVWTAMLWECQVRLLRSGRYTVPQAQQKMLGYLVAALKATPFEPTFTEARDALLAVTRAASANDDFPLFVEAFAARGLGLQAIAPPRDAVGNTPLAEDTSTTGAHWRVVSFSVSDVAVGSCDADGILDSGEAGEATVRLLNVGAVPLTTSMLTLTSAEPRVKVGAAVAVPATAPFAIAVVKVPVSLPADDVPAPAAAFTVSVTNPALVHQQTVRLDVDRVASATEGFEAQGENFYRPGGWIVGGSLGGAPAAHLFRPLALTPVSHAVIGHDLAVLGDSYLFTPPLQVGAGPFSFTFTHSYAFDTSSGTNFWDGGILEISTDRFTWTQIPGSAIVPTYDGPTRPSGNPLAGLPAFVVVKPVPVQATVSLGTQYANQTVYVRFRIGTDASIGATGWQLDDVAFTGLTNAPFTAVVPHRKLCGANLPPTVTPPADFAADERTSVVLVAPRAVDPNGDPVAIAWSQLSGPMAALTGAQLTLPEVPADTPVVLRATATDGKGGLATADFTVTVRNVNRGPSVTAVAEYAAISGAPVALQAAGTDPDGDALTLTWSQTEGPTVQLSAAGTFTAPEVTAETVLRFGVSASDGSRSSGVAPVKVTVVPKPVVEPPMPMKTGCGCGATSAGPLALAVLLLLFRRRAALWLGLVLLACGPPPVPVDAGMGGGAGGGSGALDAGFTDAGPLDLPPVDAGTPDGGLRDAGPFDAGHRTLTLPRLGIFTTAPDASVNDNPAAGAVKATCLVVEDGGWEQRASVTVQPGLMRITEVRDGACILSFSAGGIVTADDAVDFSTRFVGRPTGPSLPSGTAVTLSLTTHGLSPWVQATDDVALVSFETGYSQAFNIKVGAMRPPAGSTSAAFNLNWSITGSTTPGVSAAAGDQLQVLQLRTFATPAPHRVPIATSVAAAPTITGAGTVAYTATVAPLTPVPLTLDHDFGDYAQQTVEHHPDATVSTATLSIQAQPAFEQLGWVRFATTGVSFTHSLFQSTTPLLQGAFTMAPPPAGTTAFVVASQAYTTSLQVPGIGATAFSGTHQRMVPLAMFAGGLPPALSPPQNLRVNGVPAAVQTAATGTRPRITWDAPRLGVPDAYQVNVFNAVVTGTTARFVGTGAVRTHARSYTVPPGLITAGQSYLVLVRALKGAQLTKTNEVFPMNAAEEQAETISGVLVP